MPLRVFTLYANPVAVSFGAALRKQTVAALRSRGHEIDDCDLHAESFDPVMGEQERMQYHDVALNRGRSLPMPDRLLAAEALVLIYPVWNERLPVLSHSAAYAWSETLHWRVGLTQRPGRGRKIKAEAPPLKRNLVAVLPPLPQAIAAAPARFCTLSGPL